MTLSRSDWKAYIDRLAQINERAGALMQQYLDANGYEDTQRLIAYAYALATKYGGAASSLACEMYDALALAQGAVLPAAEPAETAAFGEVAKAVRGTMKNGRNSVPDTVSRLVKQAGADTTVKNALRDGAEWAWIPSGDTCAFCLTLASRGWQKASKKTLRGDHAEHIHAHCNCEFAIRFDGRSTVAGYDPETYREAYDNAEGSTPKEKINALRRDWYAGNKEKINQQKRAAYAKRAEKSLNFNTGDGIVKKQSDKRILPLSPHNMHNSSDAQYEWTKRVPPIEGYDDIFIHGDADGVSVHDADGKDISIPGEEFISALKQINFENKAIRLCACETGAKDKGFAAYVAKEMGMPVMAPTTLVWISFPDKNGVSKMELYAPSKSTFQKPDYDRPGRWRIFNPDGSIKEVPE